MLDLPCYAQNYARMMGGPDSVYIMHFSGRYAIPLCLRLYRPLCFDKVPIMLINYQTFVDVETALLKN